MKRVPAYPAHRYDEQLVIKIPPLLWLTMLFLIRHAILVLLSYLPRTGEAMTYLRYLVDPLFLVADLPAVLILFAAVRRKPGAPDWIRALWGHGRPLLALSSLLYLVLLMASLFSSARPLLPAVNEVLIVSVLLNLAIVAYLVRSTLVRDVFAEFPKDSRH
jgi:hypothetical protein